MAISLQTDIDVILTTAFGPDLVRLWNRRANLLANCVKIEEGDFKQVFWAASAPGGAAKAVAEGYQVQSSDFNIDTMVNLSLSRAQYLDPFSLSDTEIAVAARSPLSPTKLIDMVAERVFESTTRITDKINQDMFSGTGTDLVTGAQNIVGLDSALITTGTYAGQNVGSITSLQSNVSGSADSGTGTALTLAQMQSDLTNIKLRSDEKPDFIVMHPWVGSAVQALFETNRRIVNIDAPLTNYSSGPSRAFNGADSGMSFMGVPILYDKDAFVFGTPGDGYGHIYYLSKRHLAADVMPHRNPMDGSNWENESFLSSGGAEDEMVGGPVVSIVSLARLGLAASFAVNVEVQLKVKRPLALGRRLDVAI
jgi:hypothetical protein